MLMRLKSQTSNRVLCFRIPACRHGAFLYHSQLGYSEGVFKDLWLVVLVVLVPRIRHLPPVCRSIFWQIDFRVMLTQSRGSEFNPRSVHGNFSVPLWVVCVSMCQSINIRNQQIYISLEPGRSSKLTHTDTHMCQSRSTPLHFGRVVSCPVPHRPRNWSFVFGAVWVAWNERAGELTAGGVTSIGRYSETCL